MNSNPPCPKCGGNQWKNGRKRSGTQNYLCSTCDSKPRLFAADCTTPGRCPYCDGRTHKRGIYKGNQCYRCLACQRYSHGPIDPNSKPRLAAIGCTTPGWCPYCNGRVESKGVRAGYRRYYCDQCLRYSKGEIAQNRKTKTRLVILKCLTPGQCPYCAGRTVKAGHPKRKQRYECTACGRKCTGGAVAPKPPPLAQPSPKTIARRRLQAAQLGAALLPMIRAALPSYLLPDVAEDIAQEMAVDALDAVFDLSDLLAMVPIYRRRINRLSSHTAKFVSIDSIVPGTTNLTYAETLIG